MAELDYKWWKKHKPLTLLSEPLSDQLKKIEKSQASLEKFGRYKDAMFILGSMAAIKKAIEDTVKKCNKTLHKDALKHLADLRIKANVYEGLIAGQLKKCDDSLAAIRKGHQTTVLAAKAAAESPTTAALTRAAKAAEALSKLCNSSPYMLDAFEKLSLYGHAGIGGYCGQMIKHLREQAKGGDVGKKLEQCRKDLEKNVKQFAAIKIG